MPTFETQGGTSPGVTVLNADGTVHTAHTTAGFTEAVTGSGVCNYPHPAPGTLLEFVFDATLGGETLYASTWDDGLTAPPARAGDAMTLTAVYDHAKDDVLTPLAVVDGKVDAILAEDVGADLGTDTCTITLHDASGGVVADARVYVSSDPDGLVRSDLRVTDALGQVRFDLTDGETYYLWAFSTRVDYTALNPIEFIAVAD